MSRAAGFWIIGTVVTLVAIIPYLPTLGYGVVWDDPAVVDLVETAYRAGGLARVATVEFRAIPNQPTGYYRPVVLLSLWADGVIGKGSGTVYHATNILLHAACAVLVAAVVEALLCSRATAAAAGLIFAAHPLHVESVAFVSGRTDLWAGLFVLVGTLAWARARNATGRRLAWLTAVSGAAVALGGVSKEVALALPAVLTILELLFPGCRWERVWWRRLWPWLGAWGIGVALVVWARAAAGLGLAGRLTSSAKATLLGDPALVLLVFVKMFGLFAVPWPLNAVWKREELDWNLWMLVAALSGAVVYVVAARWRGWRTAVAGGLWSVAFLAPALGIDSLALAPFAERFLFVPSVGFCLAAGALFAGAFERRRGARIAMFALGAVVFLFMTASAVRSTVWRDEVSLVESLVSMAPGNAALLDDLGQAYEAAGRHDDATRAYRQALQLDPKRAGAWNGLGVVWGRQGKVADAAQALREAIRLDPRMPHPRFNLALLCLSMEDRACAEEQRRALEILAPAAADQVAVAMRRPAGAGPGR